MESKLKGRQQIRTLANLQDIRTAGVYSIPRNNKKAKCLRLYMFRLEQERLEKLHYIFNMRRISTEKQWDKITDLIKKTEKELLLLDQKKPKIHPLGFA